MEDILLSVKQYQALLDRLNEIRDGVTTIKFSQDQDTAFIDSYNLARLLQVSSRTLFRWRKEGRLPYVTFGKKIYYRADLILSTIKVEKEGVMGEEPLLDDPVKSPDAPDPPVADEAVTCVRCPLYLLLKS